MDPESERRTYCTVVYGEIAARSTILLRSRHSSHFGHPSFNKRCGTNIAVNLLSGLLRPLDQRT